MRFTHAEAMTNPRFHVPLAQAAEAAGFDAVTVADSLSYPRESDSTYPYTPDGSREFLENKEFVEVFVLTTAILCSTTRLRAIPFVLKLPMRPPLLVAKQAASIAWLSGGRLSLGVGVSPWREDYELMGVPWARRGVRMDESIDVIRGLVSGDWFGFDGEMHRLAETKIAPVPDQPVPILVGGHSEAALRRAAVRGDGWMHAGGDGEELIALISRLQDLRREVGAADKPFEIHAISGDAYSVDGIRRLEELGVTDVIVGFRWPYQREQDSEPLQAKIDQLNRYAEKVIHRVR